MAITRGVVVPLHFSTRTVRRAGVASGSSGRPSRLCRSWMTIMIVKGMDMGMGMWMVIWSRFKSWFIPAMHIRILIVMVRILTWTSFMYMQDMIMLRMALVFCLLQEYYCCIILRFLGLGCCLSAWEEMSGDYCLKNVPLVNGLGWAQLNWIIELSGCIWL